MSREAIGENGAVLGSGEYWSRINCSTFLGGLMQRATEADYQETLRRVGNRAGAAVEEVYDDLQSHKNQLRDILSDRRNALAEQVRELYGVCRMSGSSCGHSGECISMLNLSGFFGNSFRDERGIQAAIYKIKNNPDFLPVRQLTSLKRLRIGALLLPQAVTGKSGLSWKTSPRERAGDFCGMR